MKTRNASRKSLDGHQKHFQNRTRLDIMEHILVMKTLIGRDARLISE